MKKLLLVLLLLTSCASFSPKQTDKSVYALVGMLGGGTGFVVRAPSGKKYILTNAHVCMAGVGVVEGDRLVPSNILDISTKSDLCLMEMPGELPALEIASQEPKAHDKIFILGQGRLMGNTLTEGHYVGRLLGPVLSVINPYYVTATVLPGNSGSPVLNTRGEVIGVVFASSPVILNRALVVPLNDIQEFLAVY